MAKQSLILNCLIVFTIVYCAITTEISKSPPNTEFKDTTPIPPLPPNPNTLECLNEYIIPIIKVLTNPDQDIKAKMAVAMKLMPMILYSFKSANDLGFYEACLLENAFQPGVKNRYYTLRPIENHHDYKVFYGLCINAKCDVGTINQYLTPFITKFTT